MKWERNEFMHILRMLVVTAVVYLGFRYVLPLVFPFVVAYLLAALVRPIVEWQHRRIRIPKSAAAVFTLGSILSVGAVILWQGGRILLRQASELARHIPSWINWCEDCLMQVCGKIERGISLEPGVLVSRTRELMLSAGEKMSQEGISYAMEHSAVILGGIIRGGVLLAVIFLAAILFLSVDQYCENKKNTPFFREMELLRKRLGRLGHTYLRCELLSIGVTCLICVIGLWVIGNPYALLIGILIGVLDALPLFGTGTVLIPWAIVCFFGREIWQGAVLLLTYGISYGLHQLLETHMLGESIGTTPILTLASLYIGMELFGLAGLILGPVGYVLIREFLEIWEQKAEASEGGKNDEKLE